MEGSMADTVDTRRDRSAETLEATIIAFIETEILGKGDDRVGPEDNLFVTGAVDSVGIMRLITHLEATLEIKIPPRDLVPKNFRTVRVMAGYLEGLSG